MSAKKILPLLFICILLAFILLKSPTLLLCVLLAGIITVVIEQIGKRTQLSQRTIITCQMLAVATIFSFFWLDYFANPAAAQFFGKAEKFFQDTLTKSSGGTTNATDAVGIVFFVLRALFLLYIAISLIGVVNAVRKDEDWQVVARTPLLVVIAVIIADVMTSFIIG
jgi:hypothetical protein